MGFADLANNSVRNAAALISGGKIAGIYHKIELPNYGVFDEKGILHPEQIVFFSISQGSEYL